MPRIVKQALVDQDLVEIWLYTYEVDPSTAWCTMPILSNPCRA